MSFRQKAGGLGATLRFLSPKCAERDEKEIRKDLPNGNQSELYSVCYVESAGIEASWDDRKGIGVRER